LKIAEVIQQHYSTTLISSFSKHIYN